jgi:hypothetical protein
MKQIALLFIISVLINLQGNAQNTFPSSGNAGIGTTSPASQLHLVSNVDHALTLTRSDGTYGFRILRNATEGNVYFQIGNGPNTWETKIKIGEGEGVNTKLLLNPDGGNVGIGTNSPLAKLHIEGRTYIKTDDDNVITFENTDNSWQYIEFKSNGVRKTWMGIDAVNNFRIGKQTGGSIVLEGANVGIGTSTPRSNIETIGAGRFSASATGSSLFIDGAGLDINTNYSNVRLVASSGNGSGYLQTKIDNWGGYFSWVTGSSSGDVEIMRIDATNRNVGIGTTNTGPYKLAVEGTIGARKVKVTQVNPWADYVFNDDYPLMSLKELDNYIHQHKHLPDVPTAAEVEKNGLDLGENQTVLLKKLEELTLYIIDQNKKLERLEKEITELKGKKNK